MDNEPQQPTDHARLRAQALQAIADTIGRDGVHVQVVAGQTLPRLVHSIGLSPDTGLELVLTGTHWLLRDQVATVLKVATEAVRARPAVADDPFHTISVPGVGDFRLRPVHRSWASRLMPGAFDYYQRTDIGARQVVPVRSWADVPDVTVPYSPVQEPAWRFLDVADEHAAWDLALPPSSFALVDVAVLAGEPIRHAARWGEQEWEIFSDGDAELTEDDVRVVPLVQVLALDPSTQAFGVVAVGEGLHRAGPRDPWTPMGLDLDTESDSVEDPEDPEDADGEPDAG